MASPRTIPSSVPRLVHAALATALALLAGACGRAPKPAPPETFHWVSQPIEFSPPPAGWIREGDNGGGQLGVRFVLRGGGGQCISVTAYSRLAERDRREVLARLIARRESLSVSDLAHEISLARARTDEPISDREAAAAAAINEALSRAVDDASEHPAFVKGDLESALAAAEGYEPTLEEILPHVRLRPERMPHPEMWKIAYERDTTVAGVPAFATDDTLFTPERPLQYRELYFVSNGCAFRATYQGTDENFATFQRLLASIRFPGTLDVTSH